MTKSLLVLVSLISLVSIIIVGIVAFNKFIKLRNLVNEAWSLIDVQLKRRYDTIPNLVQIVKSYVSHEKKLFTEIAEVRALAMQASTPTGKTKQETALNDRLASLMVAIENYPKLKADKHFLKLQNELYNIEDAIQMARRYYNGAVRNYNIAVQSFPSNIVANILDFESKEFFQLDSLKERQSVLLSFQDSEKEDI